MLQTYKMIAGIVFMVVTMQSDVSAQLETQTSGNGQPVVINISDNEPMPGNSYWNVSSRQDDATDPDEQEPEPSLDDELSEDNPSDDREYLDDEATDIEDIPREPALVNWPDSTILGIVLDPQEHHSNAPDDQSSRLIRKFSRDWSGFVTCEKVYMWEAPNIRYQPLFFEDIAAERYGQVVRDDYFQTIVSAAHFFSSAALLPLHMRHEPIFSCDYPLGYCRPGNCTNQIYQRQIWGRRR